MNEIQKLIQAAGGNVPFSKLHSIPLRTVQDWAAGRRCPPKWVVAKLAAGVQTNG